MPVFISYSHRDKEFAQKLAAHLVKANTYVWVDTWELNVGDSIVNRVQEAIGAASALLVILSQASVQSEWCKKELSAGLIRELEEKRVVVLPLLLEDCEIPIFLKEKLYADFRVDFDTGLQAVMESIARVTNCNQGRITQDYGYADWAVDWGYIGEQFALTFTIVRQGGSVPFTILMEVRVLCNERATARYKQYEQLSLGWIGRHVIAESIRSITGDGKNRIALDDQFPHEHTVDLVDGKTGIGYAVYVRCRRLGDDTGKTTLINLDEYLEDIVSQMHDRTRRLTPRESEALMRLISQPPKP